MSTISKNYASTLFIALFAFTILLGGLVSEFFQAPLLTSKELTKLQFLYNQADIQKINKIEFSSGLSQFTITKDINDNWIMTSPKEIMANKEMIQKILNTLEEIKIKKIYPKDQINIANFSLDNPISTLKITTNDNESKTLSFGLVNPIDNSTYLKVDNESVIYHINVLNLALERIEVTSMIDSQPFNLSESNIKELKIFPGKQTSPTLQISKTEDQWMSANLKIDATQVASFVEELNQIKSHMILDQMDEATLEEAEKLFSNPAFKLEVKYQNDTVVNYEVSNIINTLGSSKLEKRATFAIRIDDKKYLYILNKDLLKVFNKRSNQLKESPIKKLIY